MESEVIMNMKFPLDQWLLQYIHEDTISDLATLFGVSETGPWLAGGSVRRCLYGIAQDSDYDFFFRNEEQLKAFQEKCLGLELKQTMTTKHAVQYEGKLKGKDVKIQAVLIRFSETPEELIEGFDFTLTMFAYDGRQITTTNFAIRDTAAQNIVVNKVSYPESSLRRIIKYSKQGYHMCGGAMRDFLNKCVPVIAENPPIVEYID